MILLPSLAVLPFNPALAFFLLLGAAIYIYVYTIWLKPRTPLNIVIGGAAGSAAVLSGSAAAGDWNDPGALLLALLVFLWTPTHFWSLAIAYRDDYARGGFPMLPVQTTPRTAAWWVLLHTGGAALAALALASHPALGWLYLVAGGLATMILLVLSVRLVASPSQVAGAGPVPCVEPVPGDCDADDLCGHHSGLRNDAAHAQQGRKHPCRGW